MMVEVAVLRDVLVVPTIHVDISLSVVETALDVVT